MYATSVHCSERISDVTRNVEASDLLLAMSDHLRHQPRTQAFKYT